MRGMSSGVRSINTPSYHASLYDILKSYSKTHGIKMYRLVENLIEERCSSPTFQGKQLLKSQLEG